MRSPELFAFKMIRWCDHWNASVTSWIRTTEHNKAVGGVTHSAHLAGVACDVVYDEMPALEDVIRYGRTLDLRVIREGDHDHLQPLTWGKDS